MLSRIAFYVLLVVLPLEAITQKKQDQKETASYLTQPERIELDVEPDDGDFFIVSAENEGLLVFKETGDRGNKGFFWEFNYIDTLLERRWTRRYLIPYGNIFLGYDYSAGNVYLLLSRINGQSSKNFTLLGLDLAQGDTSQYAVKMAFNVELSEFEVVGDVAIFGGYANYRPVISLFSFSEQSNKVLPGFYNNKSELLDIETDDPRRQFNVLITDRYRTKNQTITLKTFNDMGDMVQSNVIDPGEEFNLIYGQSSRLREGNQYISGTYSIRKSSYSKGVYVAKFYEGEQMYLKYYAYADLENFFSYLPAKRRSKVKERIKRRKVRGKKVRLNYRLLVHDVLRIGDNNVLIGEAYYPKYTPSAYGPMYSEYAYDRFNTGIEGYRYTHAVVIAFDKEGNITWDNSFEINDVLSYTLKQYVHVASENDRIVLLYLYDGEIRSKLIEGDDVTEGKTYNPIKLNFEDDVVQSEDELVGGLEHWYGSNFYAHGIQKIRKEGDRKRREIYYINKIVYR